MMAVSCRNVGCRKQARTTWALVPLCDECRKAIFDETIKYYKSGTRYESRTVYLGIVHLIPWAQRG